MTIRPFLPIGVNEKSYDENPKPERHLAFIAMVYDHGGGHTIEADTINELRRLFCIELSRQQPHPPLDGAYSQNLATLSRMAARQLATSAYYQ